jgi:hypothetical protein
MSAERTAPHIANEDARPAAAVEHEPPARLPCLRWLNAEPIGAGAEAQPHGLPCLLLSIGRGVSSADEATRGFEPQFHDIHHAAPCSLP